MNEDVVFEPPEITLEIQNEIKIGNEKLQSTRFSYYTNGFLKTCRDGIKLITCLFGNTKINNKLT